MFSLLFGPNAIWDYQENPPIICDLSRLSLLSLSWLLQVVIEKIESEKLTRLKIKTAFDNSRLLLTISTPGGNLPEKMIRLLNTEFHTSTKEETKIYNLELSLILLIFKGEGIRIESTTESSGSEIKIFTSAD